eukprot:NODE_473_length_868_cov_176.775336_g417_i0.p1 GENE.NODE_473_length_868_cov_176.775336_g417_i0~~NODE_473_length_868_cov_176.775336_g417_i0.p1  ORF type:complete len:180 (+),score=36.97 NODE_473_length_868_cov_176.775336_g417_i0:60-599(+)
MRASRAMLRFACTRQLNQLSGERKFYPEPGFRLVDSDPDHPAGSSYTVSPNLVVTLTRQDEWIYNAKECRSITVSTGNGYMGILPGHEYVIEKLEPGILDIDQVDGSKEQFAVAGGWIQVNNDGHIDINTPEAIPLKMFDAAKIPKAIEEVKQSAGPSEMEKAQAQIMINMMEIVQKAL